MRIVIDLQACQSKTRMAGIGRYSMAIVQAMVAQGDADDVWLALNGESPDSVNDISRQFPTLAARRRIVCFHLPGPQCISVSANAWRARAAELARENFLSSLNPDVVLVCHLFDGWEENMTTSIGALPGGPLTAVIHYDLIPWLNPASYLSNTLFRVFYESKLASIRRADLLLAISEYSRQEVIDSLGLEEQKVVNISAAADGRFKPHMLSPRQRRDLLERHRILRPFVFCSPSGFDSRKNVLRLVEAFAALPAHLRDLYQLVISGTVPEALKGSLTAQAASAGLAADALVLTGFVADEDLVLLYGQCELFVFPSLHEGFGLPVLEAMSCGAPAISSAATSLLEVVGWDEATFDPQSSDAIRRAIQRGLTDPDFRQALRSHAARQARRFSWDSSATKLLEACRRLVGSRGNLSRARPIKPQGDFQSLLQGLEVISKGLRAEPMDLVKLAHAISQNEATVGNMLESNG